MKQKVCLLIACLCLTITNMSQARNFPKPKFEKQSSFFYHGFYTPSYIQTTDAYVPQFDIQALGVEFATQVYRNDYMNLTMGISKTGFSGIQSNKKIIKKEETYNPKISYYGPRVQLVLLPDSTIHFSYAYFVGKGNLDLPSEFFSEGEKTSLPFEMEEHQASLICKITDEIHFVASGIQYSLKEDESLAQQNKIEQGTLYSKNNQKGHSLGLRFTTM